MPNSSLEPPTLSEVIRRLDELRADVRDMGGRFVSVEVYLIDKAVHDREAKEMRERIASQEKESDARDTAAKAATDARELRAQEQSAKNRQFFIGIIVSPFVGALVAWIIAGGIRP